MPRIPISRKILLTCVVLTAAADASEPVRVTWDRLHDFESRPISLEAKWKVVCFLGAECPLAQLYGARLQKLEEEFARQGVRVVGINSNPQDSVADIKQYSADLKLSFPIIKDGTQSLAKEFGASRTPEVFVLDAANRIRYQGRIDDQYEPGISRADPTQHDLRAALEALIAGRNVPTPKTVAVGCLITFIKRQPATSAATVTFTRDVAPILNRHCVECHREGEIGPFALTDYAEVIGWGEMMLEVIAQKRMPPWHADPRYGKFIGARHFPDEARRTLAAWVKQGMPEGDLKLLPPQPKWTGGWHLKDAPDVVLKMRDRPFVVPADGIVEYQYFVVDPQWKQDRWVRAAQVIPGNAAVVHHSIVFARAPDGVLTSGIGWLGAYVPGQRAAELPPGHARHIPAGSKLVFQMHYTPNGRKAQDVTRVGVWFSEADAVTQEVTTRVALNHEFEIPPGAKDEIVKLQLGGFARDSKLLAAMPHMHLRGKSFHLEARRDQDRETLLLVPNYDFNWQHWYQLESPLPLMNVDALQMEAHFDNSAQNPTNPDPKQYVTWGDQTWEEMAVAFFDISHPRAEPRVAAKQPKLSPREIKARQKRIDAEVKRILSQLDKNGDGSAHRDEVPDVFRQFGFYEMDLNQDNRLDRKEIEAAARQRL